ncbi:hypothetical protein XINFAN_00718 [Pseudogemmobacter humi]|uniref:Uncharacterized protein n=1 Tax=Pseudogemmobacter humi TaxID=2483812 RepID=A0A3P5X252_9RHOB|nr:hypothetical protein XINFAN_00718 [Pseudogemmobacter humi]
MRGFGADLTASQRAAIGARARRRFSTVSVTLSALRFGMGIAPQCPGHEMGLCQGQF